MTSQAQRADIGDTDDVRNDMLDQFERMVLEAARGPGAAPAIEARLRSMLKRLKNIDQSSLALPSAASAPVDQTAELGIEDPENLSELELANLLAFFRGIRGHVHGDRQRVQILQWRDRIRGLLVSKHGSEAA